MANLLKQLKSMTVVVADTGDIDSIQAFTPRDATTNPSLIHAAAGMPRYQEVVDSALGRAREESSGSIDTIVEGAVDRLAVEFGTRILEIIPGRVSTEVDARLSFDTQKSIKKARHLIALYEENGVGRERILIKIASTWEGIRAAEILEKEGIHCNLTLLFGLHQAVACAQAGVTLISPFVGRILDWHKAKTGRASFPSHEDPGVKSVTQIYNYYKKYEYPTEVMGASFRNLGQITELAGCDLLTIAPKFLEELQANAGELERKLSSERAGKASIGRIDMNREVFDSMHAEDEMATDKLAEGIERFAQAQVELEELLKSRLAELSS